MKALHYAKATALPYLATKLWQATEQPRKQAVKAAKAFPGHVRDVLREKREASK